jgi:hypothetical protein
MHGATSCRPSAFTDAALAVVTDATERNEFTMRGASPRIGNLGKYEPLFKARTSDAPILKLPLCIR